MTPADSLHPIPTAFDVDSARYDDEPLKDARNTPMFG